MTTPTRLRNLAARQHWLLSTRQLRAAGLTPAAIEHRRRAGRLFPERRGVYAVGHPADTVEQRLMAAVLALGPSARLSHETAGWVWGVLERLPPIVHVSMPTQAGLGQRPGLRVHRCGTLTGGDVVRLLPVTTLARTLRDLAGVLPPRELRSALRQAERVHRIDLVALRAAVELPLRGHREARLRDLIEQYVPATLNRGLEERFFEALVRARVRLPETQQRIGERRVDYLWRAERLVVETDDRGSHDTWTARQDDMARDRELDRLGYTTLRVTWAELQADPTGMAREIAQALARRTPAPTRHPADA